MPVTHQKVSAIPDSGNDALVEPSDWNAGHTVSVDLGSEVTGTLPAANGGTGNTNGQAATVTTINGKITAGTNIALSGAGTTASPYNISASGGGSVDVQLFDNGGTNLGSLANEDGSILFQDTHGNLSQDYIGNFVYDPDGSTNRNGFGSPTTLYIGDQYNQSSDGTLCLWDNDRYDAWAALQMYNGSWSFSSPGSNPGTGDGNVECATINGNLLVFPQSTYRIGETLSIANLYDLYVPNDSGLHQYLIGGFLNATAVSVGTASIQIQWYDENGTGRNYAFGVTNTATNTIIPSFTIVAKYNTIVTFSTIATGTITYDVGVNAIQLN